MVTFFGTIMFLRGFFLIWMMMILFLLVCCCLRDRNLYYCKTSSLTLIYPQEKENPFFTIMQQAVSVFLAEPLGALGAVMPLLRAGTGTFPGAPSHSLGLLWLCRGTSTAQMGLGGFTGQAARCGWLRVFGGSAPVPDGWDQHLLHPQPTSCCSCPGAGVVGFGQSPQWGLWD